MVHASIGEYNSAFSNPINSTLRFLHSGFSDIQKANYTDQRTISDIPTDDGFQNTIKIDDLNLPRVDFIRLNVHREEIESTNGAKDTIERCNPIISIEGIDDKCPIFTTLEQMFSNIKYKIHKVTKNYLAIHVGDPAEQDILLL